jgi:hypothetical protein
VLELFSPTEGETTPGDLGTPAPLRRTPKEDLARALNGFEALSGIAGFRCQGGGKIECEFALEAIGHPSAPASREIVICFRRAVEPAAGGGRGPSATELLNEFIDDLESLSYTASNDLKRSLDSIVGYTGTLLEDHDTLSPVSQHYYLRRDQRRGVVEDAGGGG